MLGVARNTRDVSLHIADSTKQLMKWTGVIGLIDGLLGTAGGLFGIDRLAGFAGGTRRSAAGLGVAPGAMQAFQLDFGRFVDPSFLSKVMQAQNDPQGWAAYAMLGINNPQNQDPAQLGIATMQKARKWWQTHDPKTRGLLWQNTPLSNLMSLEELRRLGTASPQEFQAQLQAYRKDPKDLSLSDQQLKAWQDLKTQLDRAKLSIENTLIDGLTPLAPELKELSGAMVELLKGFFTDAKREGWFKSLATDIKEFAHYLETPEFKQGVKDFVGGVEQMGAKIVAVLKLLGLIPDKKEAAKTPLEQTSDVVPEVDQVVRDYLGTRAAAQATLLPTLKSVWGQTKAGMAVLNPGTDEAMAFFMHKGWSGAQAAGIAANLIAESNLDPTAPGDNGKAFGIAQWHSDRQALFKKIFGHDIQHSTLQEQLKFVEWELEHSQAGRDLTRAKLASEAGSVVSREYERPADPTGAVAASRGSMADTVFSNTTVTVNVNQDTGGSTNISSSHMTQ